MSRIRNYPDDDLITELRMLTGHRADLVADRTRTINRLRQQLGAVCPTLERAAQLTQDRGWVVLLARYQRPKAIRRQKRPQQKIRRQHHHNRRQHGEARAPP